MGDRTPKKGFAIFAVIIGVVVLSALTLTALDMGTQETRSARATRVSASALYTAEAGVNAVRAAWPTTSIAPADSLDLGWTTLSNGSKYRPWIHRRDVGVGRMQIYSLTVEGWSPGPLGGQASVQVWATRFTTGLFNAALSAKGNVTLSGTSPGSITDSYDSRLGDYGAALEGGGTNVGSTGGVLTNGSINLSGNAEIRGDVTASGTVNDPTRVTGNVTTGAPPEPYPVEACPIYTPLPTNPPYSCQGDRCSFKIGGMSYTLYSGTYSFHDFRMENGAVLVVPAGNAVKIYLSGLVNIGGGSSLNNQGKDPRALSFSACNRNNKVNNTEWQLHGGSGAYMTVWAPNNKINLNGGSPIYGAIVSNEFVASGGASIHFDRALTESNSLSVIMPRSWRQLLR